MPSNSKSIRRGGLAMLGLLLAGAAMPAHAAQPIDMTSVLPGWQPTVSVRVGTLGIGPEVGIRIPNSNFGIRANFNAFSYTDDNAHTQHFRDGNAYAGYDVDAKFRASARLLNGGITADYYPFGSGFRLEGGLYINGDRLTGSATAQGTARVGNQTYQASNAGTISAKALTNEVAPYFGFGYSHRIVSNLIFSADAGILVEGSPRTTAVASGPISALPAFNADLQNARNRANHDIDVPVYPVVQLGLGWRF